MIHDSFLNGARGSSVLMLEKGFAVHANDADQVEIWTENLNFITHPKKENTNLDD